MHISGGKECDGCAKDTAGQFCGKHGAKHVFSGTHGETKMSTEGSGGTDQPGGADHLSPLVHIRNHGKGGRYADHTQNQGGGAYSVQSSVLLDTLKGHPK